MWRARVRRTAALACAALLGAASAVSATGYAQVPASRVTAGALWFDAKATMGDFRGITRTVRGEIGGGATLTDVRGFVEFDARGLTTDNGLRDRDMRSSLEVDKHPQIRFDLDSVRAGTAAADSTPVTLFGRMRIHGVTRPVRVPASVRSTGGAWRVTGGFPLVVTDYGIGGLRKLFGTLRMEERVEIGLDLTFSPVDTGTEVTA